MAIEVRMPKLGMTMTEGKIIEWLKAEGDYIEVDEPLYVVANAKVNIDVESPEKGILLKILVDEGDVVPVGEVVAYIGEDGDNVNDYSYDINKKIKQQTCDEVVSTPEIREQEVSESGSYGDALRATPAARAIAKKMEIDINLLQKIYGNKRIKKADVEAYYEILQKESVGEASNAVEEENNIPYFDYTPTNTKLVAAERMSKNFNEAPHFYLLIHIDATKLKTLLSETRGKNSFKDIKPTFTDVLTWFVSRVIKENPIINSQWNDGKVRQFRDVNFGIATDTPEGLVVPVIHSADKKSFMEIVRERHRLVSAARKGQLTMDDMSDGTFTLSNLGMFGIDNFHAILNTPEAALLTVGSVSDIPYIKDGELKTKAMVKLSLSCDHRVLDGATGAKFLKSLKDAIEEPSKLLDKDLF